MTERVRVESWGHLHDALFADSWDPTLERFRSRVVYRGLSDARYGLQTTLARLGGDYAALERHLLRNFRKYAHGRVVERDSLWHWLALAKHHGLPARLLDWTSSPYIALHFATCALEHSGCDATIWAVDYERAHGCLPPRLRELLAREGANVFTVELLGEVASSFDELAQLAAHPYAIFFEPPSMDDRIVNQYAFFSLMSDARVRLDEWLAQRAPAGAYRQIYVPARLKWEVRDKLDQAGITERVIFPGLDGLSAWLRRYYSPRNAGTPERPVMMPDEPLRDRADIGGRK